MRAGWGAGRVWGAVEPDQPPGGAIRCRDGSLRRIERRAAMGDVADRTVAIMSGRRAARVGWAEGGSRVVMTDDRRLKRVGGGDTGRPAGGDRCQDCTAKAIRTIGKNFRKRRRI
jgi:hypothetical protein